MFFSLKKAGVKKTRQSEIKNIIGKRVRLARLKMNPPVSQDDLSGRLARQGIQMTQTGISKLESGKRAVLDYEVVALAKVLKVDVEWLLEGR